MDKKSLMVQRTNLQWNNRFKNLMQLYILYEKSVALHLVEPGLVEPDLKQASRLDEMQVNFKICKACCVSYSTVVLYSMGQYEIIGLLKISHSIKQPCGSVCQKKC